MDSIDSFSVVWIVWIVRRCYWYIRLSFIFSNQPLSLVLWNFAKVEIMEFVVENVGHLKNVSESLLLVAFNRLMLFSIEIRSSYISGRAMASSLSDAWVFVASFFCWLEGILPQFSDIFPMSHPKNLMILCHFCFYSCQPRQSYWLKRLLNCHHGTAGFQTHGH